MIVFLYILPFLNLVTSSSNFPRHQCLVVVVDGRKMSSQETKRSRPVSPSSPKKDSMKKQDSKATPPSKKGGAAGGSKSYGGTQHFGPEIFGAQQSSIKEDTKIEEELPDLTDKQIDDLHSEVVSSEDANDGKATSYAGAAAKNKKDYPYAIYVQSGDEQRAPISKAHFSAFQEEIWKRKIKLTPDENDKLIIDWVCHKDGYGIMGCQDSHSATWVKEVAAAFLYEGTKTRGWSRWERGQAFIFQGVKYLYTYVYISYNIYVLSHIFLKGFLHGAYWKKPKTNARWAIGNILKMNNLFGEFEVTSWDAKGPKSGCFMAIQPHGELIEALSKKRRLNAGICTLILEKRLRKERTEADFINQRQLNSEAMEADKD